MVTDKSSYKETEIGLIPTEWQVRKLGDFAKEVRERNSNSNTYEVLSVTKYGGIVPSLNYFKKQVFSKDTSNYKIIRQGQFAYATIHLDEGSLGMLTACDAGIISPMYTIFETNNEIDRDFLYRLLKSDMYIKRYAALGQGSVNRRKSIPFKVLSNLSIHCPPLSEQRKIAAILTSVDEAIEKTEAIIKQTEKVKKGLMQQLLTKGIGHTEFKQTEIGEIPIEWEVKRVSEIARVIRGASPRPKGDPRYYGGTVPRLMVADVTRDKKYVTPKIDFLTNEGAKLSRPMPAGSLVIVCSGVVGVPAILAVDSCIHDGFLGLYDIAENYEKEFLFYSFSNLRNQLDSLATHGGVFTNLTTQIMKEFLIAIPPKDEQVKIAKILTAIDDKINHEDKKLERLCNIKKGLMQSLLTGKVRVKVDENTEVTA